MKTFHFGQVVLLRFPHTDGTSVSKRPALVLSDMNDEDIIVCRITSKTYHSSFDIPVEPSITNGLMIASVIRVHKIATLSKTSIIRTIGLIEDKERSTVQHTFYMLLED